MHPTLTGPYISTGHPVDKAGTSTSVLADDRNDHRAAAGAIVDRATGGAAGDLTETLNVVVRIFQGGQQVGLDRIGNRGLVPGKRRQLDPAT